ncbi:MAG: hypothetical protein KJ771_01975 [Nanoarchaeota archaeon]|nr:hypothetical protein [Nanoarchaeota archaeon]
MNKKIIIGIVLILLLVSLVLATTIVDDSQAEFDLGTYSNTVWDTDHLELTVNQTSGTYTSKVFDAGAEATWNNLSWQATTPLTDVMIAGDNSADIWKSTDSGLTWELVNDDYNDGDGNSITDLAVNSSGARFILNNQDIWNSVDAGTTWTKVNDNYNGGESNNGLVLAIDSNNNLFIIEGDEEVWSSTDQGVTWTKVSTDFNGGNGNIFGIAIDGSDYIYVVDGQADVWQSTNLGVNWTLIKDDYNDAVGNHATDMTIDGSNNLFILDNQDLWKSTNSGLTWVLVNDDFNEGSDSNSGIVIYTDDNNYIYIVDGSEDLFQSTDSGISFTALVSDFNGAGQNVKGVTSWRAKSNLSFEVRNCSTSDCSDASFSGTYSTSPQSLDLNSQYFQYQTTFSSEDPTFTPELNEVTIDYYVCIPSLTNTSWSEWTNISCLVDDTRNQSRSLTQYDENFCGEIANQTYIEFQNIKACDYCTPSWTEANTTCQINDTLTGYFVDNNNCFAQTGLGSDNNPPANNSYNCNYCSYSVTNTSWTSWENQTSCLINDTYFQNHSKTEYDTNYDSCYTVTNLVADLWNSGNNNTYWETQDLVCDFCTPSQINTSWTEWNNISCLDTGFLNQSRSLTQYDQNWCGEEANQTYTETQATETCDYCTPNLINITTADWTNVSSCYSNNTIAQERNLTQYDQNWCGETINQTYTEQRLANCTYVAPPTPPSGGSSGGGGGGSSSKKTTVVEEEIIAPEAILSELVNLPLENNPQQSTNLFDIGLEFTVEEITNQDELLAKINLVNFSSSGLIEVNVTYTLTDNNGAILHKETVSVPVDVQTEFLKSFNVSTYLPSEYSLLVELQYADQVEEAKAERSFTISAPQKNNGNFLTGAAVNIKNIFNKIKFSSTINWLAVIIISLILLVGGATTTYYLTHHTHKHITKRKQIKSQIVKGNSKLIMTSAPELNHSIIKVLRTKRQHCIYLTLNKSSQNVKNMLKKRRIDTNKYYFIDCVTEKGKADKVLYISPERLDLLQTAVKSFINNISGRKIIMIDTLERLRDYNNQKKITTFVNKMNAYAAQKNVPVFAFTLKKEIGEDLQEKIFNFFDQVKK